jgi:hypothetical protein
MKTSQLLSVLFAMQVLAAPAQAGLPGDPIIIDPVPLPNLEIVQYFYNELTVTNPSAQFDFSDNTIRISGTVMPSSVCTNPAVNAKYSSKGGKLKVEIKVAEVGEVSQACIEILPPAKNLELHRLSTLQRAEIYVDGNLIYDTDGMVVPF